MRPWVAIFLLLCAFQAAAHEVRPAYLELTEQAAGEFAVLWKVPALGGLPLAGEEIPHELSVPIQPAGALPAMPCGCPMPTVAELSRGVLPVHPTMPKDCEIIRPPRIERLPGAELRRWTIRVPHGLDGWEVTVHGLSATMVDVLVRIALADGRVISHVLRPDSPSFTFTSTTSGPAVSGYFLLGVEHILRGIDHLLFVLCLLLLVRGWAPIAKTITAFTLAHSVTLGLAALGYVHVPTAPVEATIALSIVFLATEIVKSRAGAPSFTQRQPWLVALTFGLLHGFGFAGALTQVGLPPHDIPLALLFFNLGVEAGQLAFVTVVLAIIALAQRIRLPRPRWSDLLPPYAIGSIAMFWVLQRITAP